MTEAFDDVVREYIEFVNQQVGAYMDALAGFAGHYARVEALRFEHLQLQPVPLDAAAGSGPRPFAVDPLKRGEHLRRHILMTAR